MSETSRSGPSQLDCRIETRASDYFISGLDVAQHHRRNRNRTGLSLSLMQDRKKNQRQAFYGGSIDRTIHATMMTVTSLSLRRVAKQPADCHLFLSVLVALDHTLRKWMHLQIR